MNKYRVYICYSKGYKLVKSDISDKKLLVTLNAIMSSIDKEKVLVICHNKELDYDYPFYLNIVEDYEEFKKDFKRRKR